MIVEADVARGRKLSSFWSIKTDVKNAGGNWVDEEVVLDGNLVTSRSPKDIPAFNKTLLEEFAKTPSWSGSLVVPAGAVLLDVDGTLIDSNYQHALAWYRAFRRYAIVLPVWRIHRSIGMGGDQLVPALVGEEVDQKQGDAIRDARKPFYEEQIDDVEPFHGAHELIVDLGERGVRVVLASSSPTKDEVRQTRPAPDLMLAALEKAGSENAVMVGDTRWDVEAAHQAGSRPWR